MGDRGAYSAILERSLTRPRTDINLHAFALLFAEIVRYLYRRFGTSTEEFERRLSALGRQVGDRFGELFVIRDRNNKRELKPINQLIQIQTNLWKILFGKQADALSQGEEPHQYMILDSDLLVNRFISAPRGSQVNCGAFVGGMIEAIMAGARFPCSVVAHGAENGDIFVITLDASRIAPEALDAK